MLAVMTVLAPSLYWEAFAGRAVHGGAFAVCGDVGGQANESGTGGSDNEVRQHHSHNCAGHVLGVPDSVVRLHIAESRDANLPEPPPGVLRIRSSRLDRPPLIPDLA